MLFCSAELLRRFISAVGEYQLVLKQAETVLTIAYFKKITLKEKKKMCNSVLRKMASRVAQTFLEYFQEMQILSKGQY